MLSTVVCAASLIATVSANCAYGTSAFPRAAQVKVSTWGYDGLKGPLNWYGLNETANYACDKGSHQSPIVVDSTVSVLNASAITKFSVPDYPSGAEFENLGTNVEVVVNGTLVDGISQTTFNLAQFHFHTPSEHRIYDEFYPMEMHWVFESDGEERKSPSLARRADPLLQPKHTLCWPFWSSSARCRVAPILS
jgi:carbonic anhydrase